MSKKERSRRTGETQEEFGARMMKHFEAWSKEFVKLRSSTTYTTYNPRGQADTEEIRLFRETWPFYRELLLKDREQYLWLESVMDKFGVVAEDGLTPVCRLKTLDLILDFYGIPSQLHEACVECAAPINFSRDCFYNLVIDEKFDRVFEAIFDCLAFGINPDDFKKCRECGHWNKDYSPVCMPIWDVTL